MQAMRFVMARAHPHAELFPRLNPEERASLAADIKANGLHEKIVYRMTAEGQPEIIDGISRADALIDAGLLVGWEIKPEYYVQRQFGSEEEVTAYIVSANIHRRHLSKGQRNELIKKLVLTGMKPKDVAAAVKTSVDTVEKATKAERAAVKAAKREAAKQAVQAGKSVREAGKAAGVSKDTARRASRNPKDFGNDTPSATSAHHPRLPTCGRSRRDPRSSASCRSRSSHPSSCRRKTRSPS